MLYHYDSVLTPQGCEPRDINGLTKDELAHRSLNDLYEMQRETETALERHRAEEPAAKRKNKTEYKVWIDCSADLVDRLQLIRTEIELREQNEK